MLIVKLCVLHERQIFFKLALVMQDCRVLYFLCDLIETFLSHNDEVNLAVPTDLRKDLTSHGQSVETSHIAICNHIELFLPYTLPIFSHKLQFLLKVLLLIVYLFLLDWHVGRIEDDNFGPSSTNSSWENEAVEERAVDLHYLEPILFIVFLGQDRCIHVDVNAEMNQRLLSCLFKPVMKIGRQNSRTRPYFAQERIWLKLFRVEFMLECG